MNILLFVPVDGLQGRHEAAHQTDEEPAQVIPMVLAQGGLKKDFQAWSQAQGLARDQSWDEIILRVA